MSFKPIRFIALLLAVLSGFAFSSHSFAKEGARVILVLDASGSMWGQIDGVTKMDIAKQTVAKIIAKWRAEDELGLVVYGHREKGSCSDIEVVRKPGKLNAASYLAAVKKLVPKGKTPMTQSVRMAAEALKFTEKTATVILVSDGIETCDPDPCAVAADLERLGVNLTVHTVGFNVASKAARAQLKCMADNTGGKNFNADDADQLERAIRDAVDRAREPVATHARVQLVPVDKETGEKLNKVFTWSITNPADETVLINSRVANVLRVDLEPGKYQVLAEKARLSGGLVFEVPAGNGGLEIKVPVSDLTPQATLKAPAQVAGASSFKVEWTGPGERNDFISIWDTSARGGEGKRVNYEIIDKDVNSVTFVAPTKAGTYELRYVLQKGRKIIAKTSIEVTGAQFSLKAPASVAGASKFNVEWSGPGLRGDAITLWDTAAQGGEGKRLKYEQIDLDTSKVKFIAPTKPGTYELRFYQSQDRKIVATTNLVVSEVSYSLKVAASVAGASRFNVEWSGPALNGDAITLWDTKARGGEGKRLVYKKINLDTNKVKFVAPTKAGTYELRFYQINDRKVVATATVTVIGASYSIKAPETVGGATRFIVEWSGPALRGDAITLWDLKARGGRGKRLKHVRIKLDNNKLKFIAPSTGGTYELRYRQSQENKDVAKVLINVTAAKYNLSGPASVMAGDRFEVQWSGPALRGDAVVLWDKAARGGRGKRLAHIRINLDKTSIMMKAPKVPGRFELRYYQANDGKFVAMKSIEVK